MYSTCLYCHGHLGANEVLEPFPVGRRIAFDAVRGRLWVVCPGCGRWNLSPLEERWEAMEEGERLFRDTRMRAQSGEIGVARLREGLELIRIGKPLRPEFAAWRYGDVLGRRRRRAILRAAGVGTASSAGAVGFALAGTAGLLAVAPFVLAWGGNIALQLYMLQRNFGRPVRVPAAGGRGYTVFRVGLFESSLLPGEGGGGAALSLRHASGFARLEGRDARRALGLLLPRANPMGARSGQVRDAVLAIAGAGGPERFLRSLAAESERKSAGFLDARAAYRRDASWTFKHAWSVKQSPDGGPANPGSIALLDPRVRLALEMSVHEESEQRALEGELGALEAEWRAAEEIAGIADNLLVTPALQERLEGMKEKVRDR